MHLVAGLCPPPHGSMTHQPHGCPGTHRARRRREKRHRRMKLMKGNHLSNFLTQRNLHFPTESLKWKVHFWWVKQNEASMWWERKAVGVKKIPCCFSSSLPNLLMSWVIESLTIEIRRFKKGKGLAHGSGFGILSTQGVQNKSFIPSSKCVWWINEPKRFIGWWLSTGSFHRPWMLENISSVPASQVASSSPVQLSFEKNTSSSLLQTL